MEERVRSLRTLVFSTALCCLMFELLIARLADFFIGFRNTFIALPVTFLGLALGSLYVHFRPQLVSRFSVRGSLFGVAGVSFATLAIVIVILTRGFAVNAADDVALHFADGAAKTAIFVAGFITPFFVFGRILTLCYHVERDHIGRIYSADFFGAALGSFITPVLFHFVSLPEVILVWMLVLSAIVLFFLRASVAVTAAAAVALVALNTGFYFTVRWLESSVEYRYYVRDESPPKTREIASRWNEFSRVQLVKFEFEDERRSHYKVIHDDARSNVHVRPYVPGQTKKPKVLDALESPFIMKREVKDALVMFAGCGDEMIRIRELSGARANVTGVEINPACVSLPANEPELESFKIGEFFNTPGIEMRFTEGRAFLMKNDKQYDMIYVGSSAPTALQVTGHTRKYLYTTEAMRAYLRALKPDGVLLFDYQATDILVETLKHIYAEDGIADFDQHLILLRSRFGKNRPTTNDLIFSKAAFTPEEVTRLTTFHDEAQAMVRYAPGIEGAAAPAADLVHGPLIPRESLVTDDHPFLLDLDFKGYQLIPQTEEWKTPQQYESWLRVTTLIFLVGIAALFIAWASWSRERRAPAPALAYLLITGFCYMLVEVALMAKLELFLQDPTVSMASVITIFLLTTGVGSLTHKRVLAAVGMRAFPFIVAAIVLLAVPALALMLEHLVATPLVVRLLVTALVTFPVGTALGMFYPSLVDRLVASGHSASVPITYGISTLASVIGASFAMTMMIPWGFNRLLYIGAGGYLALGAFILVHALVLRRTLLA
jgi:SAM-dependent methyltransferase